MLPSFHQAHRSPKAYQFGLASSHRSDVCKLLASCPGLIKESPSIWTTHCCRASSYSYGWVATAEQSKFPPLNRPLLHDHRRAKQPHSSVAARPRGHPTVENRELLIGDCLLLVAFCLYKQITAIILNPAFPGWLEPLHFNPARFGELASFSSTLTVSWVLSALLVGGYTSTASADLRTALRKAIETWLISMPVAACQLVLLTAAEGQTLVGSDLFATSLPLAASGPGEPVTTAAGVLGIMAIWRCFYAAFLDSVNFGKWRSRSADNINRLEDMNFFVESLKAVFFMAIAFVIVLQYLSHNVGEEHLKALVASARQAL